MAEFADFLHQIDWQQLRVQKAALLAVIDKHANDIPLGNALSDIVSLIDSIQDEGAEEFDGKIVFGESKNENCLQGIKCPKCGNENSFNIEMSAAIEITDDGTDMHTDTEWDGMSYIICNTCDHDGRVWQFKS